MHAAIFRIHSIELIRVLPRFVNDNQNFTRSYITHQRVIRSCSYFAMFGRKVPTKFWYTIHMVQLITHMILNVLRVQGRKNTSGPKFQEETWVTNLFWTRANLLWNFKNVSSIYYHFEALSFFKRITDNSTVNWTQILKVAVQNCRILFFLTNSYWEASITSVSLPPKKFHFLKIERGTQVLNMAT